MMRTLLTIAALVTPISAIAQSQVPNVFEDGTPASAAEVNANFQYVLESASGGYSAEQVDNTAEITCVDGTTAVVPGYGTVVIYPEGGITGGSPAVSWATGTIIFEDANGGALGEAIGVLGTTTVCLDEFQGTFLNNADTEQVVLTGWGGGADVYFLSSDCSGQGCKYYSDDDFHEISGELFVRDMTVSATDILIESARRSGNANFSVGSYSPAGSCRVGQSVVNARPVITYTPAPEILNAAYPVRLEQLP